MEFNQDSLGVVLEGVQSNVDIVFVIDATRSMDNTIKSVREVAKGFYDKVQESLQQYERKLNQCRVKVIVFRDYYCDGPYAMEETDFYYLPDENDALNDFLDGIEAKGGGDDPENGLEALALAMRSDWVQEGNSKRHIVVLFTDNSAHPLEKKQGIDVPDYPEGMLTSYDDMMGAWNATGQDTCMGDDVLSDYIMDANARRLVLYTPDAAPWSDMVVDFENAINREIKQGEGGTDIDSNVIMAFIGRSLK